TATVTFQPTAIHSILGNSYTGFFGILAGPPGQPGAYGVLTLANIGSQTVNPGQEFQVMFTNVCCDPTCTTAAPSNASPPNTFSMEILISSPNSTDIGVTPQPQFTAQFLNSNNQVNTETVQNAQRTNSQFSYIPGINLAATPATRYFFLNGVPT